MAIKFNFDDATPEKQKNNLVMAMDFGQMRGGGIYDGKFGYISFRPAFMNYYHKAGKWSYDFYSDWFSNDLYSSEHVLHWLTLKATFSWREADKKESGHNYFGEALGYLSDTSFNVIGYNCRTSIDKINQKARFIKRLVKGLDDISSMRGEPRGLGEMAQRFGEVLGVTDFLYNTDADYSVVKGFRVIAIRDIERIVERALDTNEVGY